MSDFGIYIHIPFCIQRCHYCDFATYAQDQIAPNDQYIDQLLNEISCRQTIFGLRTLNTIYFGGGTPSLLSHQQIHRIITHIKNLGYDFASDIEITIEVNPATLTEEKCQGLKEAGVNRLSIGCQTFHDQHLEMVGREHRSQQTLDTIALTQKYFDNYSLDLLFSLPEQGLKLLTKDIEIISQIDPPHVSAYCLTLKDQHPLNRNRVSEEEQIEMFELIESKFEKNGLHRYEISNFAKPGFESRHNTLYWTDQDYWGVGLSAHSYISTPDYGARFWNPSSYDAYMAKVSDLVSDSNLDTSFEPNQIEFLKRHESMTDFCHTHLRLEQGLSKSSARQKFGPGGVQQISKIMHTLENNGLIQSNETHWALTASGRMVSNQVFASLLFSEGEY